MEQLHLVGVHEDGEHLIVEGPDATRFTLAIDQQLRQAVQHARRKPAARRHGNQQYGPRDIQARFRSGATVDDVVAESGWEPERVKRYEWPILAERAHMVREACKVTVSGTGTTGEGYRSVFEGEPRTLRETVESRASATGVDPSSFEWDSWQREDQLWTLQLRFRVDRRSQAPVEGSGPAEWAYNPASRSLRPVNDWARALGEEPRESGPLGSPAPVAAPQAPAQDAVLQQLQQDATRSDELLDVLQARRGRRLGADADGDDRLAEILGRGMGHVDSRPRPIDAPQDSPLFDRPIQPAAERVAEDEALRGDEEIEIVGDAATSQESGGSDVTGAATDAGEPRDEASSTAAVSEGLSATVHRLSVAHGTGASTDTAQHEDTAHGQQPTPREAVPSARETSGTPSVSSHVQTADTDDAGGNEEAPASGDAPHQQEPANDRSPDAAGDDQGRSSQEEPPKAPGPRSRTSKARRSSVPSWDEIVFGSNRS